MIIAKNDEAKRSRIWTVVTTVSSILIVLIAVFLLMKLFTSNPLEGTWEDEDGNYILTVKGNDSLAVNIPALSEDSDVEIQLDYVLDKEEKTITIKTDDAEMKKIIEKSDGLLTEETVENTLSSITNTFGYSVDGERLTLTEREYGEQLVFNKK